MCVSEIFCGVIYADADYNAHEHDEQLVDSLIVHPAADGLADYAAADAAPMASGVPDFVSIASDFSERLLQTL